MNMTTKYRRFAIRILNVLVIAGALFYYNHDAMMKAEIARANSEIERANARIGEMTTAMTVAAEAATGGAATLATGPQGKYKDGVYSGTAEGYGGPVTTELTIENGFIVGIEITAADGEDAAYYNMCLGILDEVVETQGADVDTVSGATFTSKGIIGGVAKALAGAVKE
jgi:uncharacterized protein with FMN-binding domain